MKFELLVGNHCMQTGTTPAGDPIIRRFSAGDIIETNSDLSEKFDKYSGNTPKFRRLPDEHPVQTAAERGFDPRTSNTGDPPKGSPLPPPSLRTLENMTVEELTKWAAEEEIDLKGAKTKEAILKAVRPILTSNK